MTTQTEETVAAAQDSESTETNLFALLFDIEDIAVHGREAAFRFLSGELKKAGVEMRQADFSRYCLGGGPEEYVPRLLQGLGADKVDENELIKEVAVSLPTQYASDDSLLNPAMANLCRKAADKGIALGALSIRDEETAKKILARLDLDIDAVHLSVFPETDEFVPRADIWMKMARNLSKDTRRCVVVASNALACKAALSAGMRCVAVPDDFTAFQDFGGTEMVLDSLDDTHVQQLVDMVDDV